LFVAAWIGQDVTTPLASAGISYAVYAKANRHIVPAIRHYLPDRMSTVSPGPAAWQSFRPAKPIVANCIMAAIERIGWQDVFI
jgi:hypothetical protein